MLDVSVCSGGGLGKAARHHFIYYYRIPKFSCNGMKTSYDQILFGVVCCQSMQIDSDGVLHMAKSYAFCNGGSGSRRK
jgi:hypothetical protein